MPASGGKVVHEVHSDVLTKVESMRWEQVIFALREDQPHSTSLMRTDVPGGAREPWSISALELSSCHLERRNCMLTICSELRKVWQGIDRYTGLKMWVEDSGGVGVGRKCSDCRFLLWCL